VTLSGAAFAAESPLKAEIEFSAAVPARREKVIDNRKKVYYDANRKNEHVFT
jgi:hypothetical protein